MPAARRSRTFATAEILSPGDDRISGRDAVPTRLGIPIAGGRNLFSDENLDRLSHLLDDCFRVPGTPIRFGLDGIVGFIPGLGDVLGGIASCILPIAGWFRGVAYITLVRMVANVAIEVTLGAVPIFGNLFDIAWKANRRNYALLVRELEQPRRHTWRDWMFLWVLGTALSIIILAPPIILITLLWKLLGAR